VFNNAELNASLRMINTYKHHQTVDPVGVGPSCRRAARFPYALGVGRCRGNSRGGSPGNLIVFTN
jgi:hypothetical protein